MFVVALYLSIFGSPLVFLLCYRSNEILLSSRYEDNLKGDTEPPPFQVHERLGGLVYSSSESSKEVSMRRFEIVLS